MISASSVTLDLNREITALRINLSKSIIVIEHIHLDYAVYAESNFRYTHLTG